MSGAQQTTCHPADNECVGFTRAQLESFRDAEVPDLVGPDVRLLFVGINPGLWTAATQTPLRAPGQPLLPRPAEAGHHPATAVLRRRAQRADRQAFLDAGIGISNLVKRATVRADELPASNCGPAPPGSPSMWRGGSRRWWRSSASRPTGRASGARRRAPESNRSDLAESELWVVPNPSGLNAHDTISLPRGGVRRAGPRRRNLDALTPLRRPSTPANVQPNGYRYAVGGHRPQRRRGGSPLSRPRRHHPS